MRRLLHLAGRSAAKKRLGPAGRPVQAGCPTEEECPMYRDFVVLTADGLDTVSIDQDVLTEAGHGEEMTIQQTRAVISTQLSLELDRLANARMRVAQLQHVGRTLVDTESEID